MVKKVINQDYGEYTIELENDKLLSLSYSNITKLWSLECSSFYTKTFKTKKDCINFINSCDILSK